MSYKYLTSTIFLLLSLETVQAQSKYGYADHSIRELKQFEYYRGVWVSELEMRQEDGSFKKIEGGAQVTGRFLDDHRTFQSQFTTPNGFFSTDIRTYNTTTKQWEALFLNAKAQRWHQFTSKIIAGKMTTIVKGGYSGKEEFDIKVIDSIIDDNNYQKDVYKSTDGMKTWILTYKIDLSKLLTEPGE
ncbi:hypothetical protein [Reichenbachiella sp.]|uniref:hypothetical protein n=1 Tax=Reichenbachiella sp. TaxID=2184521 RepID=UPI003BAFB47D